MTIDPSHPCVKYPQELLHMAAAELAARHPKHVTYLEFYGKQVIAHMAWCGVVVVTCRRTGVEFVRSVAGQPTVLDRAV